MFQGRRNSISRCLQLLIRINMHTPLHAGPTQPQLLTAAAALSAEESDGAGSADAAVAAPCEGMGGTCTPLLPPGYEACGQVRLRALHRQSGSHVFGVWPMQRVAVVGALCMHQYILYACSLRLLMYNSGCHCNMMACMCPHHPSPMRCDPLAHRWLPFCSTTITPVPCRSNPCLLMQ